MKITVMGASGLIGSQIVEILTEAGHEVVSASRNSGVDVLTGEGVAAALDGADALIDVLNSPSFEDDPVLKFFTTSTTNLVATAKDKGVGHYVALSIVGDDGLPDSGYMRAKVAQEKILVGSGVPYSIVRATQFQEFAEAIVGSLTADGEVHAPDGRIQPIAAAEVSAKVASVAAGEPLNGIVNIGGPEKISFAELARRVLAKRGEITPVVIDAKATYFGTAVDEDSLVTGDDGVLATKTFTG